VTSIAVIGATGRTGRLVVEQALTAGHRVTALARRTEALETARAGLTAYTIDLLIPGSLRSLLDEHDAVISAVGTPSRTATTLYSAGTAEIIAAVKPNTRLLLISSAGLSTPAGVGLPTRLAAAILHRIMRETYADMARTEQLLATSELNWTAVRPTRLTDRPPTGHPRISIGAAERVGPRTSRADLAAYLLAAINDPRTYKTAVALSS
jgi:putative NADH-flavin reductase